MERVTFIPTILSSQDEAEKELRKFLGKTSEGIEARHLKMRVGKMRNLWAKNCLAVGLAGSFLEPLEATSILFTELQLGVFLHFVPFKDISENQRNNYNRVMDKFYHEIRDFIVLHYYLSKRDDTSFWRAVKNEIVLPDSVKKKLKIQKDHFAILDQLEFPIFTAQSYHCLFAGMNYFPEQGYAPLQYIPGSASIGQEKLNKNREEFSHISEQMP